MGASIFCASENGATLCARTCTPGVFGSLNRTGSVPDKEGKPYSVRYDQVNAMLLNEFFKEHHQVQDLKAIVAEQQSRIDALTAGLEKVSAQVQLSKPKPQTVLNNH
jgi:hypothetical protein